MQPVPANSLKDGYFGLPPAASNPLCLVNPEGMADHLYNNFRNRNGGFQDFGGMTELLKDKPIQLAISLCLFIHRTTGMKASISQLPDTQYIEWQDIFLLGRTWVR